MKITLSTLLRVAGSTDGAMLREDVDIRILVGLWNIKDETKQNNTPKKRD